MYTYMICVESIILFSYPAFVEPLKVYWKGQKANEAPAVAGGDRADH